MSLHPLNAAFLSTVPRAVSDPWSGAPGPSGPIAPSYAVPEGISVVEFVCDVLGVQPPMADWGGIVKENKDGLAWGVSAALIPAVAIAVLAISVNLVADWVLNRTTSLKGGRGA